jgi:hypothetical protein
MLAIGIKTHKKLEGAIPMMSADAIRLSRLLTRLLQLAGSIRDSISRVFPSVSQVPSALYPGVTGFHQHYSYVLGSVPLCC